MDISRRSFLKFGLCLGLEFGFTACSPQNRGHNSHNTLVKNPELDQVVTSHEVINWDFFQKTLQIETTNKHRQMGRGYITLGEDGLLRLDTVQHVIGPGIQTLGIKDPITNANIYYFDRADTLFGRPEIVHTGDPYDLHMKVPLIDQGLTGLLWDLIQSNELLLGENTNHHPNLEIGSCLITHSSATSWKILTVVDMDPYNLRVQGLWNITHGDATASLCAGMSGSPAFLCSTTRHYSEGNETVVLDGVYAIEGKPLVVGTMESGLYSDIPLPSTKIQMREPQLCSMEASVNRTWI